MKKRIFFLSVLLIIITSVYSQGWHLVSVPGRADSGQGNCQTPVYNSAFSLGNYGYVGSGENGFWKYNVLNNVWEDVPFPATTSTGAISFSINGKGYFGLGQNNDFWQLDSATGIWTQMASYPGSAPLTVYNNNNPITLPETAFTIDSSAYFGYGSSFYQYTPSTNTWTHKHNFPGLAVAGATWLSVNGIGYIIGGWTQYNGLALQVWAYNPVLDTFIQKNPYTANGGFVSNNRLFVFLDVSTLSAGQIEVDQYNDATDSWAIKSTSPLNIFMGNYVDGDPNSHVSFSIGSKGYIGSEYVADGIGYYGIDPSFWEYDPDLNTWTQKANLALSGLKNSITATIDSIAYMFGGDLDRNPYNASNNLWTYNGNNGQWQQKSFFPGTARTRAIGFAINGKFYAGGGSTYFDTPYQVLRDFWEYDPATDTWTQKDSLPAQLQAGYNYAYGGVTIGGYGFFDNYRYDPTTDSWDSVTYYDFTSAGDAVSGNNVFYGAIGPQTQVLSYNPFTDSLSNYTLPANLVDTLNNYDTSTINQPAFARGGKVDFLFGRLFFEYDTLTKVWSRLPDFPGIVSQNGVSFVIGNKAYCGFGDTSLTVIYNKLWVYDEDYTPPSGINVLNKADISLYPNPVSNQFTVWSDIFTQKSNISSHIFDMSGREVVVPFLRNGNSMNFDASGLSQGVYSIRIDYGEQEWIKKFVKVGVE